MQLEFELMDAWMRITVYKKDQMRNLFLYNTINIRNLPFQVLEMF